MRAKAEKQPAAVRHKVKRGDTLASIARRYDTNAKTLQRLNGIKNARSLRVGQSLRVPGGKAEAPGSDAIAVVAEAEKPVMAKAEKQLAAVRHKVRRGDTLSSIAHRYDTDAKTLQRLNGIKSARSLRIGQSLRVPGGEAEAPRDDVIPVMAEAEKPAQLSKPKLRSGAALVVDATDSSVLFEKGADVAKPIASITKLMTALVVLEGGQPLEELIEVTSADRAIGKGAHSRLSVGAILSRGDLLVLALMASENRSAHALARSYPGGMTAFVKAMNAKAKALGMTSARFADPSGLSSGNVASPEDLAKLVIAASENPTIRKYTTHRSLAVRIGKRKLQFRNTNALVSNPHWDVVLQKTGYISEAGRCMVMRTVIDGRSLVIVLLNSTGKQTRLADARRIRTWVEALPPVEDASQIAVNKT